MTAVDEPDSAPRYAVRLVRVTLIAGLAVAGLMFWNALALKGQISEFGDLQTRGLRVIESLRSHNEALSMFAKYRVLSGEELYAERYRNAEQRYAWLLRDARQFLDGIGFGPGLDQIEESGRELIHFENSAFDLLNAGRQREAIALLNSAEHNRFADMFSRSLDQLQIGVGTATEEKGGRVRDSILLALIKAGAVSGLLALACFFMMRLTRGWTSEQQRFRSEMAEEVAARRQAEDSLSGTNADLSALMVGLQAQNIRFDAALNNMSQGLCLLDSQQRLVVSNRRFREIYGIPPEVLRAGASFREISERGMALGNHDDEDADRALDERMRTLASGEEATLRQHLQDGRIIAVQQISVSDGGTLLTYQDVTAQANAERELRAHAARLEHSNRELQEFAFVASHDLQEPLRKIEAFGDRLQAKFGDVLNDDGKLYLERMQSAAKRMRTLIDDLLSYSRVTSQAEPFRQLALADVVKDVVSDLEVRIEEVGAVIRIGDLPKIDADRTQMRQLFQNLLSNALKFRKPDTLPEVTVSSRILSPEGKRTMQECEITVTDNGIGFDEKYLDRIFSIFQRLHGKAQYEGNGIGLATVRKIIDRHGGAITAKSMPGQGATFIITLPLRHSLLESAA
jgi:signal transduction histidine kinase